MDGKANCIICKEPLDQGPDYTIVTLGEKGRASLERNDSTICTDLGNRFTNIAEKSFATLTK